MTQTEKRITAHFRIDMDRLRGFCIRNGYYTHGTNSQYSYLLCDLRNDFNEADEANRLLALRNIATDIMRHSDPKIWECYDSTPQEVELNIMSMLTDIITTWFEIE